MQKLKINSTYGSYEIVFTETLNFVKAFSQINTIYSIDEIIFDKYEKKLFLKKHADVIKLKSSESLKTLNGVTEIYNQLLKKGVKRNLNFVSIGGGVIQDATGFVASTLFRGVHWTYIPTTLLAMADSCIGGKTSLNYKSYKNLIGTFYPPKKIIISTKFLDSLNEDALKSGLGEIIKLLLIGESREKIKKIPSDLERAFNLDKKIILNMIKRSLEIKKDFIETDEFDSGKRNILNYGHTYGHALESVSNFKIPHGSAVVVGMILANTISLQRKKIDQKTYNYLNENLFLPAVNHLSFRRVYFDEKKILERIKKDKKRTNSSLSFILANTNLRFMKVDNVETSELSSALKTTKKIFL